LLVTKHNQLVQTVVENMWENKGRQNREGVRGRAALGRRRREFG